MKILVLGGTGFIGSHVVARLCERSHCVAVLHRGKSPTSDLPKVSYYLGERRELEPIGKQLRAFEPSVVVDMIGYCRRDAKSLVNVFGGSGARVISLSSVDCYRNRSGFFGHSDHAPDPLPLTESSPLRERYFPYADHKKPFDPETTYEKILVEETLRNGFREALTILRAAAVYGPKDRQHRVWPYLKRMRDRRPFILIDEGMANWRWTRVYVENLAAMVVLAVETSAMAGQVYNAGERQTPTEREWIARIAEITGWNGEVIPVPNNRLPAQLRLNYDWRYGFAMAAEKISQVSEFIEPIDLRTAMQRTVEWETAFPPENPAQGFDYAAEDDALGALGGVPKQF